MQRRQLLASLGPFVVGACSPVGVLNALAERDGIRTTAGLAYAPGDRHGVDIYAPTGAKGAPVVVFFYGGSWQTGERSMYRFLGASLAAAGLVCMVPDYRLFPQARFPTFMQDAASAVAWARSNAVAQGGDPRRLLLMGHSAGALIATLLALDDRYLAAEGMRPAESLRGVIGLSGPYDFLPLRDPALRAIFGPEERWPESQPVNFVRAGAPPVLLATGDADSVVLPRNTASLATRLRATGNEVRTISYQGVGHSEILGAFAPSLSVLAPVREDVLSFVVEHTA